MASKERPPFSRNEAWAAAIKYVALAANRELVARARFGDCGEFVAPRELARWEAVMVLVRRERHLAVTLLRFAWGRGPWSAVETALREVAIRRHEAKARDSDGLVPLAWRENWVDDIGIFLKRRVPSPARVRRAQRRRAAP